MKHIAWPLVWATAAAAAAHLSHRAADAVEVAAPADPTETYASPDALRLLSVGHKNVAADLYWLRAIADYGSYRSHELLYPNLEALLRRTLSLDPLFADAYLFAGNALTTNEMDPRPALEILGEGMERRPDQWRIAFLHGFTAYHHLGEDALAAASLERAAASPDAPSFLGPLAARVAAAGRDPEVALSMLDSYLESSAVPDAGNEAERQQRELYLTVRDALVLEVSMRRLQRAVDAFAERTGRRPNDLDEVLRAAGLGPPPDPFEGRFFLDADGRVATTSEEHRLKELDRSGYLKQRWKRQSSEEH